MSGRPTRGRSANWQVHDGLPDDGERRAIQMPLDLMGRNLNGGYHHIGKTCRRATLQPIIVESPQYRNLQLVAAKCCLGQVTNCRSDGSGPRLEAVAAFNSTVENVAQRLAARKRAMRATHSAADRVPDRADFSYPRAATSGSATPALAVRRTPFTASFSMLLSIGWLRMADVLLVSAATP